MPDATLAALAAADDALHSLDVAASDAGDAELVVASQAALDALHAKAPDPEAPVDDFATMWTDARYVHRIDRTIFEAIPVTENLSLYAMRGLVTASPGQFLIRERGGDPFDFAVVEESELSSIYEPAADAPPSPPLVDVAATDTTPAATIPDPANASAADVPASDMPAPSEPAAQDPTATSPAGPTP